MLARCWRHAGNNRLLPALTRRCLNTTSGTGTSANATTAGRPSANEGSTEAATTTDAAAAYQIRLPAPGRPDVEVPSFIKNIVGPDGKQNPELEPFLRELPMWGPVGYYQ
jgi:hypothetical protein